MKVAILADTHAGVRNNSSVFMAHQLQFFEEIFFPYVEENKIEHMIHLGDVFDRRKDTNNFVFDEWDRRVFARWNDTFKTSHLIIGNHDTYFKNTNKVNAPERFLSRYGNFTFYREPLECDLFGVQTLILPWLCEENEACGREMISGSLADLVIGHLEIIGCPMFRGIENLDKGFEQMSFKQFKKVLSGHFHMRSHQKNIDYLGSPYPMMWSEAFDTRGFHIMEMDTLKTEFIENPHNPFVHIEYADTPLEAIPNVREKIVRVLITQKTSEVSFLEFLDAVQAQNPAEVNVQEQAAPSKLEAPVDESLDLFSLMDVYVDSLAFESPKAELKGLLRELYHEALHLHDISE